MPKTKLQSKEKARRKNRDRMRMTRSRQKEMANQSEVTSATDEDDVEVDIPSFGLTLTVEDIAMGKFFDRSLKNIKWNKCKNCKAGFPEMKLINEVCERCVRNPQKYTKFNNMYPGEVPDHLPKLNDIEQMLIALNHPLVIVYRKRGGQNHYSGHVIHFPQNITTYVNKLPHTINNIPYYVIFDAQSKSGSIELEVDASKLREWLLWLKTNYQYYHHIEIDEEAMTSMGKAENVTELFHQLQVETSDHGSTEEERYSSLMPSDINLDQDALIAEKLHLQYPEINARPINEFDEVGYF